MSTLTATCADCNLAWRGPTAHERGEAHQEFAAHIVWYDEDMTTTENDWDGVQGPDLPILPIT